jgi:RNA polymerase-binding transcription factor DksA
MSHKHRLTRAQLRDLEAELKRERTRLERSLQPIAETDGWRPATEISDAMSNGGVALQPQTRARYEAIVDALGRLAAGSYGTCASCEQPIPYGRLIVMPETTRCISCPPRS